MRENLGEARTVPLDWKSVTADHVRQAFESIAARQGERKRNEGLVVCIGNQCVSAKETLRQAYRLAKDLPPDAEVKFSSGDATLSTLRKLGFRAERLGQPAKQSP